MKARDEPLLVRGHAYERVATSDGSRSPEADKRFFFRIDGFSANRGPLDCVDGEEGLRPCA